MTRGNGNRDGGTPGARDAPAPGRRRQRRTFTAEHKLRVLAEYDSATAAAGRSAVLRREGLTATQVAGWRRARRDGSLGGARGGPRDSRDVEVERLRRDNARLEADLARARLVIDVQGKVSALLGTASGSAHGSSTGRTSPRASRRPATLPS